MSVQLSEDDLNSVKKIELYICQCIADICGKHNVEYSLGYGSMLGAIRHKGFIPWDDDMDLIMLRSEYNQFIIYAENELPNDLMIVDYEHTKGMGFPFAKIVKKGTIFRESISREADIPHCIYVDLFVYDGIPNNQIVRYCHRFINYQLKQRILIACHYTFDSVGIKRIIYRLLPYISHDKEKLVIKYRDNQCRYSNKDAKYVSALCGIYPYSKECIPKEWFDEYTNVEFEGHTFRCISKYKEYLTNYYGNYMVLPPPEQRVNKHTLVEFALEEKQ